jgi:hypothetical protein
MVAGICLPNSWGSSNSIANGSPAQAPSFQTSHLGLVDRSSGEPVADLIPL